MLVNLFTSKLRVELLALFFMRSEETFYLGEIVEHTGKDRGNISRELRNLESIGLLISRKEGNLKYYSLRKIVTATIFHPRPASGCRSCRTLYRLHE
ncbi:MAG: helix-turn-helix domain-containing protein [Syntrophales bacterium]|nr:helix-turn-helix domain-containing protein [Syntrophales bacterium]